MSESNQLMRSVGLKLHRGLMVASLSLSVALLWGEARSQSVQGVMHGAPLTAAMICSLTLFVASLVLFRRQRRMAIYGLLTSMGGLVVCLLPTV